MNDINVISRLPAPAPQPQALAFDGQQLWLSSIATDRIYAMDPVHWTIRGEAQVPGKPWGMAALGDELRIVCGETADDHRVIRRFIPGHGFKSQSVIACPDDTGSHLSYDGERLFVSQWYNKRLVELNANGKPGRVISVPHGICGQVFAQGFFFLLTTDDEENGDYLITRIDPAADEAQDIARVPFRARALAHDGSHFWTNHREQNESVSFTLPRVVRN